MAAESVGRDINALLARTIHELRTPLNSIIGYAQLFPMQGPLTEDQRQSLDTIERSCDHLLELINDILDLSCLEAGGVELVPEAVDLPVLVRSIADLVRVSAEGKRLAFAIDLAPALPAVILDARRLRQVLLNLLGNAVKFTDIGAVALRVCAQPIPNRRVRLYLEIEDTGIGIDAQHQQLIFEPYKQVGDGARRRGGSGLGLSITRSLVHAMGGELRVESEPGRGSRFTVLLTAPLAHAPAEPRELLARDTFPIV
ncbi:MAG TPA: ATP-binding protein [Burkholderiaceae bacterium]|nr:ATP-binding protein [Burkholderiaceae bacterium]